MQYFLDEYNQRWAFEDHDTQAVIDQTATDNEVTLTSATEAEFIAAVAVPFAELQFFKIDDVDLAFAEVEKLPVTAVGYEWNSGYLAGIKYKAGYDLAELADQTEVGFKDTSGTKHTLSLANAKTVLLAIGADYLTKDAVRDDLIAQVNAATTQADLDAIVISF